MRKFKHLAICLIGILCIVADIVIAVTGDDIVKNAEYYLLKPEFQSGGYTEETMDCSGLVSRAVGWKNHMYTTGNLHKEHNSFIVGWDNLQRGDIILGEDHVVIFTGNIIDSKHEVIYASQFENTVIRREYTKELMESLGWTEARRMTITTQSDQDNDLIPDQAEIERGLDPNDPTDVFKDIDGDGITNAWEYTEGTDMVDADSDMAGESDGDERARQDPETGEGADPTDNSDDAAVEAQRRPGNDRPDESYSVSELNLPNSEKRIGSSPTGILMKGFYLSCRTMINEMKNTTKATGLNFDAIEIAKRFPVLVIPTGGLYGLDSSPSFRQKLDDYVSAGGTLICFAQQHGYEFHALPGEQVSGYGWGEDISCLTNAVYIDTYHPIFAGQDSANLDAYVDGYFSNWPENATILLRRTKNGMPAMITYPYGNGWVVASSLYTDWSYGYGGKTQDELNLVRDLISWAKNPDREIKEYKLGEMVSINVPVTNHSNTPSDSVVLTLLDPNRNIISTTEVVHPLYPGESTEIAFTYTASLPLGIWWVNYTLKGPSGNTIQYETEGERFQVSYHYVGGRIDEGYKIWAVAPVEQVVAGTEVPFTIHVKNNEDIEFTGDIAVYTRPGGEYCGSIRGISVLAHTEGQYFFSTPVKYSTRFCFALFDEPRDYAAIRGSWRNYCVAYAEKAVWVILPQLDTNVKVDKEIYQTGEKVRIEVGLKNRQNVDYSAELKIVVIDAGNIKIFEEDREVILPAGGSVSETASLVISTGSARGIYVVRVETSRNGEIIGFGSTYFEVPRPILTVTPGVPDTFSLSSPNEVSFLVRNAGLGDVSDGKLEVVLEDPEKNGVWSETRDFTLQPGESTNLDFLISLGEVKFGDYRLINRITTEGGPTGSGLVAIPCFASTQMSFDKLLYKTGEPLSINL